MSNFPTIFTTPNLTNAAESAANTETVVATLAGVQTRFPGQNIVLNAWIINTPGAAATAVQLRIRRAGLTGTLVGPNQTYTAAFTAASRSPFTIAAEDQPGEGSFTYVLTYQGTGEGGAASFQAAELQAVLN